MAEDIAEDIGTIQGGDSDVCAPRCALLFVAVVVVVDSMVSDLFSFMFFVLSTPA